MPSLSTPGVPSLQSISGTSKEKMSTAEMGVTHAKAGKAQKCSQQIQVLSRPKEGGLCVCTAIGQTRRYPYVQPPERLISLNLSRSVGTLTRKPSRHLFPACVGAPIPHTTAIAPQTPPPSPIHKAPVAIDVVISPVYTQFHP